MSKNKFIKKLLVAGLCALTATATIGTAATFAGCKKDKENEEQTQTDQLTVTFKYDDGTTADSTKKVDKGGKVSKPTDPTREGYKFDGWILSGAETAYDFNSVVNNNITLKAKWTKVDEQDPGGEKDPGGETKTEYTITWDLDGGSWPDGYTAPAKVEKDGKITAPTAQQNPTKADKVFDGWLDASGVEFNFNTAITANTTIKAKWGNESTPPTPQSYTVSYDMNGHGSPLPPTEDLTTIGANDLEVPSADGWTFGGWYLEAACTTPAVGTTLDKNTTVYAKWTEVINYTNLMNRPAETIVYNNDFSTDVAKLDDFSGTYGTKGIYNDCSVASGYVKVADGVAQHVDSGDNCEVKMVTDFGLVVGVVEGYFELKFASQKNSWTPVQFATTGGSEIFGIRIDGGKLKYRLNGSSTFVEPTGAPTAANDTAYNVAFKFDTTTKKFSMTINGTAYVTDLELSSGDLGGVRFVSSNGGSAICKIDNLVIVNSGELSEYKTNVLAKLQAAYDKYDVDTKYTQNGATLTAAFNTAKDTIESAETTTREAVITAYNTAIAAMKEVKSDLAVARENAVQTLSTYKQESDYSTENWALVQAEIENGTTAINQATTEAAITEALDAAKLAIDAIPDNNAATWTISFSDGTNACGTHTVVQGQSATLDALKAKVTVPSGKKLKGIYTSYSGGTYSDEITENYTPTADETLYVEFEDVAAYVVTFYGDKNVEATDGYVVTGWTPSGQKTGINVNLATGENYTKGVKLNSGGNLAFNLSSDATVTFYCWNTSTTANTSSLKITATDSDGVVEGTDKEKTIAGTAITATGASAETFTVTISLKAGNYKVERGSNKELTLLKMVIA